jgi:nicotinate-nucleotide adenylyltransferase
MAGVIGVFGGTFDPPHLGHLILADEARVSLGLDRILWVVTGDPPHKPAYPVSPIEHRLALVSAAIAGVAEFELSRADVDRPAPHYTLGTLQWLRAHGVDDKLVYLMGSDSLNDLPGWYKPAEFIDMCHQLGVLRRPGSEPVMEQLSQKLPLLPGKTRFFEAPLIEISGTDIRQRIRHGEAHRFMVLPRVADIIQQRQLYQ